MQRLELVLGKPGSGKTALVRVHTDQSDVSDR
jgi:hypothetical protein